MLLAFSNIFLNPKLCFCFFSLKSRVGASEMDKPVRMPDPKSDDPSVTPPPPPGHVLSLMGDLAVSLKFCTG